MCAKVIGKASRFRRDGNISRSSRRRGEQCDKSEYRREEADCDFVNVISGDTDRNKTLQAVLWPLKCSKFAASRWMSECKVL
jgi:hypothetical protein